ncbi:Malonyl CoA-acyl carrier protein transacylase [Pandoraea terrae]|uniref:[acyl-carrier-protein] S-malonyltransferase n=1 Tax=Pandoraea terrae TaxID=1537710 RepID=A0A5E4SZ98_9BURK|nr:malonate decarboxylase subunit epsilon [Pandoraea terrae]VVD80987.1 Malonyl CoA-acyl carrier protein transacylase [Pandoraea terrae]
MSVLFTFPGQGGQRTGMLHALPDAPEVARTLSEAHAALGRDPLTLDSEAALRSTVSVQLCLLIAGVAMARVLIARNARPDMVAGLSIGAWPAAVVANVLDFADAVRLVELRGQLMEAAYPSGFGMVAIVGLREAEVAAIVSRAHSPDAPAYVANLNAETQTVVAGADAALEQVRVQALASGASRACRLAMSVPSHCPLLDRQAAVLADAVKSVSLRLPRVTYVSGSHARVLFRADTIGHDLAWNMARQVHWHDAVRHAYERGARLSVEMPGGGVLTRLAHAGPEDSGALSVDTERIDSIVAHIQRNARQ